MVRSVCLVAILVCTWSVAAAQDPQTGTENGGDPSFDKARPVRLPSPSEKLFPNLKRLSPLHDVWIDKDGRRVVLQSAVCQRRGPLELFACIHELIETELTGSLIRRGTKEYESIVTVNTPAALVHTALLAIGANSGSPAQFRPTYQPARGDKLAVTLHWIDDQGKPQRTAAQQWIRNLKTGKAMDIPWVFAGSQFAKDPRGREQYLGESGNLICISNFNDSVLDLPINSPQDNAALLFEAYTERIPPMGTVVTIELQPTLEVAKEPPDEGPTREKR